MICGKNIFKSRQEAMMAINGFARDKRAGKSKVNHNASYFCVDCNGWHLTSSEQKRPKIKPFKNHTEDIKSELTRGKENARKSNTQNLIIHGRNFKIR